MVALLTNMDEPLGAACGNAVEVEESIDLLRGAGSADTREVTLALAAEMLVLAKVARDVGAARVVLEAKLADGSALRSSARSWRRREAIRGCSMSPAECCRRRRYARPS